MQIIPSDLSVVGAAEAIVASLAKHGTEIDILVNNAGLGGQGHFADIDPAALLTIVQVNVVALMQLTRLLLPGMVRRKSGKILNIASIAAFYPGPLTAVYNASKAFVLSLGEALAIELQGTGVIVTTLCPGPTNSRFVERAGMTGALAFRSMMESADVARCGYDALMRGRRVATPGWTNRLRMIPVRLLPRRILAEFSRKFHEVKPAAGQGFIRTQKPAEGQ